MGGGRVNQIFSGKTSRLSDPDIKEMLTKYPVKENYGTINSINDTLSDKKNDNIF
jgi:hypothetical protein